MIPLVIASLFLCQALSSAITIESSHSAASRNVKRRIDRGGITEIRWTPWLATIHTNENHICDGSILSETTILTAAHCIIKYPGNWFSVRVGSSSPKTGGTQHDVVAILFHENYTSTSDHLVNNVALLKVRPPMLFRREVSKVELPSAGDVVEPGEIASIAGWRQPTEKQLRNTSLQISHSNICQRNDENESRMTSRLICTAASGGRACLGSPGGPFVIDGVQVGMTIWDCSTSQSPKPYLSLAVYRDWIDENLRAIDSLNSK